jgi:4'-phosphopantetheinyl transferase
MDGSRSTRYGDGMIKAGLLPLTPQHADIWLAFPSGADTPRWRPLEALLSPSERHRMEAFQNADTRLQFLAAHALLRWALSRYAPVATGEWDFGVNGHGKPQIQSPLRHRAIRFNLSHTHGLVACAIGPQEELGVDVEFAQRLDETDGVMDLVLTPEERALVAPPHTPGAQDKFLALWTLKEAYVKARGMGFDLPPMDFRFESPLTAPRIRFSGVIKDDPERWKFQSWALDAHHRLSIAVAAPGAEINIFRVGPTAEGGFTPLA